MDNSDTGKTVLAADDSAVALLLLSRLLKGAGYRVITAADGIEAAQRAYAESPDLIVLDITMPRMNGYQVCRLLKRDPAVAHIPVIILTGADSRGTEFWSLHTAPMRSWSKVRNPPSCWRRSKGCWRRRPRAPAHPPQRRAGRNSVQGVCADG
jgi:CheY-like chemotaxis protein